MNNNLSTADLQDFSQTKLADLIAKNSDKFSRIFHFAQVIKTDDSNNTNRVKARIPIIDDIFYKKDKDTGDAALPWCLPMNQRFIDTPEQNDIVLVAVFDLKNPYLGRLYFNSIGEISTTDLFTRLLENRLNLSNWYSAENNTGISFKKPAKGAFDVSQKINYKTGIRGKSKNKLLFDKDKTTLIQNEGDKQKETKVELTENFDLSASDLINLLSKKGKKQTYHPLFHDPVFKFMEKQNTLLKNIVKVLNTTPAITMTGAPCVAGTNSPALIGDLTKMIADFNKLKKNGYSEKIKIN